MVDASAQPGANLLTKPLFSLLVTQCSEKLAAGLFDNNVFEVLVLANKANWEPPRTVASKQLRPVTQDFDHEPQKTEVQVAEECRTRINLVTPIIPRVVHIREVPDIRLVCQCIFVFVRLKIVEGLGTCVLMGSS